MLNFKIKNMRRIIIVLISILLFYSCDKENKIPYNGHLKGEVKYTGASNMEVDNVIITLSRIVDNKEEISARITKDGKYDLELPAGNYTMKLKGNRVKSDELPFDVKITAEETRTKDINIEQLPNSMVILYNDIEYKSGDTITLSGGVALDIWNKYSSNSLQWNVRAYPQPSWIIFEELNGTVTGGGRKSVVFSIDKSKMLNYGVNYSDVILTTEDNGSFTVKVKATNDPVSVVGVTLKNTTTLAIGETEQLMATIQPNNATNKTVTWSSDNTSIATVSSIGLITAKADGTATITVTTDDGNKTAFCVVSVKDGVRINGIIWAKSNVGLPGTFSSYDRFYQWNRIATDIDWEWNGYFYAAWDSSNPSGTSWEKENCPCPQGWRVPTRMEFESLINAGCTWLYGSGCRFGSGSNTIFLPDEGICLNSEGILGIGVGGSGTYYWSSTQADSNSAYVLYISVERDPRRTDSPPNTVNDVAIRSLPRAYGLFVRCVAE